MLNLGFDMEVISRPTHPLNNLFKSPSTVPLNLTTNLSLSGRYTNQITDIDLKAFFKILKQAQSESWLPLITTPSKYIRLEVKSPLSQNYN